VQIEGIPVHWPAEIRERLDAAVLAISVVTLAELRAGHIKADWSAARRERAEKLIGAYLRVPLDMAIVDEFARLSAACILSGANLPDNNVWIAATATVRGCTVVSTDKHFDLIPGIDHVLLSRKP
jgi:predicted nucleic acid-binding protein